MIALLQRQQEKNEKTPSFKKVKHDDNNKSPTLTLVSLFYTTISI